MVVAGDLNLMSHLLLVSSQTGIMWNFGSRKLTEYEFIEGLLHHVPRSDDQSITSEVQMPCLT